MHNDLSHLTNDAPIDREQIRARLRKMTDKAVFQFGKDAAFLCRPEQNHGKPPRETFVVQLEEARAEWRLRLAKVKP